MARPDADAFAPFTLPLRREGDAAIVDKTSKTVLVIDPDRDLEDDAATRIADHVFACISAAQPVAEEALPVAWVIRTKDGHVRMWTMSEERARTAAEAWGMEAKQEGLSPMTHTAPDALRAAGEALEKAVWSLSSFGQLAQDDEGGNTEGLDDEVVVRMTFPDPEFGGEKTLLGELFIRAFRKARATTDELRQALAALQAEQGAK